VSEVKKKHVRQLSPKEKRTQILLAIGAILIVFVFLFPLYWLIQMSFKNDGESFGKIITYYPHTFSLKGYMYNFDPVHGQGKTFFTSLANSLIMGASTMCLSLIFGLPAAYGLGRYKNKILHSFLLIFLVSQMLPASVMLTPLYLIFTKFGMLNNRFTPAIAIASACVPFTCVTLRPYFKSIPAELDDAARIDGCSVFRSFFSVMLPTVKNGAVTCAAISFLNGWNDLLYTMTFNMKTEFRPLTANINKFKDSYGTKWNAIFAYGTILIIPVCLIFIFLQKQIVSGLTAGAVKG